MPNLNIATSIDDLLPASQLMTMSGLEFMEKMRDGELPRPPIAETLNFVLSSVEAGKVTFKGTPEFNQTNPMGTVHGGWYGTILDSCMACAVMTIVPKGSIYTTLEYKININRSIPLGLAVMATGTLQHAGRSTGTAIGEIRGVEDGKLYATGSTTCIIMDPSKR
ncbi:MAG: PaaI family thioesterase [Halocynthiibacter sp.]